MAEAQSMAARMEDEELRTIAGTKNFHIKKNYHWQSLTRLLPLCLQKLWHWLREDSDPRGLTTEFEVRLHFFEV